MKLDYRHFEVPLSEPLSTADGTIHTRRGFILKVCDAETDTVGFGEATPLPGWTESLEACETALERAAEKLSTTGPTAAIEATESTVAARHGVSLAIADYRATAASTPLYRYLGEPSLVGRVPVNATIGDAPVSETVQSVRAAVDRGFDTVKIKVGQRSIAEDLKRIEHVRDAVGGEVVLRTDANGAWTYDQAVTAIEGFSRCDVSLLEQPLPAGALEGHAALRGQGVQIALDEGVLEHGLDAILKAGAADTVILKPMALGGIDIAQEIAAWVSPLPMTAIVTTTIDAVVARTAAVHLAAAIPDVPACGLATGDRLETDLGRDPIIIENGAAVVPQTKGIGVTDVWEISEQ